MAGTAASTVQVSVTESATMNRIMSSSRWCFRGPCGPLFSPRRSRGEDKFLALADMPGNYKTLDPVDDPEQDHAKQRQDHQGRKHGRQVKGTDRALQHVADARIGT